MSRSRPILRFLLPLLLATLVLSCDKPPFVSNEMPVEMPKDVLATVNGTRITATDLKVQLDRNKQSHEKMARPERHKLALDSVILQELVYRKALELGLDNDPSYQKELQNMEAQFNSFKRRKLASLYHTQEIMEKAEVSDAEARTYFAENESWLRTRIRVWQILYRDQEKIQQDLDDLTAGNPFEKVAGRRFPNLPESANKPWVLEWLQWHQVPEPWRKAIDGMKVGETSGVIHGPNNRFWIIKLIERDVDPDQSFEDIQAKIKQSLKREKARKLKEQSVQELREAATIVYLKPQEIEKQ